jgi:DNA polymerase-3 subunit epsilon
MPVSLEKPIVFFDLETTGRTLTDRIVEISCFKLQPDRSQSVITHRVNPQRPIPKEATAIHGITTEDVQDKPAFHELAEDLFSFLEGCDLGGYNCIAFDIPILTEEFQRAGYNFPSKEAHIVDVMKIYHHKERRDLEAAYRFYCNKELKDAHNAEADIKATAEVFLAQMEKYDDLGNTVKEISSMFIDPQALDFAGKLRLNKNGEAVFTFGANNGKRVKDNLDYARWMLTADFAEDTKRRLREIIG